jgi:diadenosine tetraphosphate (Ap4A) HIT family hydrolase
MFVAERLSELLHPVKMNEIHSNTLAHLHMHLIPRRIDDPFVATLEAGLEVPVVGERQAGEMSAPFTNLLRWARADRRRRST